MSARPQKAVPAARGKRGAKPASAAFTQFYEKHLPFAVRLAMSRGVDCDAAHDLAHDAFVWMLPRERRYRTDEDRRNALARCVMNKTLDYLTLQERQTLMIGVEVPESLGGTTGDGMVAVLASEQRQALGAALGSLSPRARRSFVAEAVWGMSVRDLCATYGLTPDSVRKGRQRARRDLREALGATGTAPALVLPHGLRAAWHRLCDAVSAASPLAPAAGVVAGMTFVVGAMTAVTGGGAAGAADGSSVDVVGQVVVAAPGTVAPEPASERRRRQLPSQGPAAWTGWPMDDPRGRVVSPPGSSGGSRGLPEPTICAGAACPLGDAEGVEVWTVHVPVVGAQTQRQNVVEACPNGPRLQESDAVVECHTEGEPEYMVEQPPGQVGGRLTGGT